MAGLAHRGRRGTVHSPSQQHKPGPGCCRLFLGPVREDIEHSVWTVHTIFQLVQCTCTYIHTYFNWYNVHTVGRFLNA